MGYLPLMGNMGGRNEPLKSVMFGHEIDFGVIVKYVEWSNDRAIGLIFQAHTHTIV